MKPDTVTIPVTLTFTPDPADEALAELARHIVTRLTDEGALDEAVEHAHQAMAVSAAIEWATERLGSPVPAVPEPAPNAGASALYGPGETLEQLARTGELDRAAGLEFAEEIAEMDEHAGRPLDLADQAVIDATRHPDEVEDEAAVDAFFEALGTDGGGIVEGSDEYNSIVFAAITDPAGTIASLDPEAEPPADTAATIDDLDVDPRSERGIELALARQERHEAAEFCRGEE